MAYSNELPKKRKSPLEIYEEFKKDVKKHAEEKNIALSLPVYDSAESLRVRLIACEKLLDQFQQHMNRVVVDMLTASAATSSFISIVDTCKYWWESSQGICLTPSEEHNLLSSSK
jgi:peroxiredoxin family protein